MTPPQGTHAPPPPAPFASVLAAAPVPDMPLAQATPWSRSEDGLPPEIARVAEGGVTVFKGGLMNPGQQTWYALDLQRRRFVAVLRRNDAGTGAQHATGLVRRLEATSPAAMEVVHQVVASAAQCHAFAALAHRLLHCPATDEMAPDPAPQGPLRRALLLLHEGCPLDLPQGPAASLLRADIVQLIQQPLQAVLRGGD